MGAMGRPFLKMNGLGNDFVVVDARSEPFRPSADEVRAIAGRAEGIGCDQLIVLEPFERADAFMRIWNADGGEVEACGNAARCVAWLLTEGQTFDRVVIETRAGPLFAARLGPNRMRIDMGEPRLGWRDIPLAEEMSTSTVPLRIGPADAPVMEGPGCVSMGNPHVVFFVPDVDTAPVERIGPLVEHHPLFPERVNVGFAEIKAPDRIRLRVWERGAGLTKACGTGACAALVAAARRGLAGRKATLELDGGELEIEWAEDDGHVYMTGPIELDYTGELP